MTSSRICVLEYCQQTCSPANRRGSIHDPTEIGCDQVSSSRCVAGAADLTYEGKLDQGALQEFHAVRDRIASAWLEGTADVLTKRNPDLLSELTKLESMLDSLLIIPNKPPVLKKQWSSALAQYEKTAMLCVTYAKRHKELALRAQGN